MDKDLIKIIRHKAMTSLTESIVNVQPMTAASGVFTCKVTDEPHQPKEGEVRHVFGRGWEVFYGGEWIAEELWMKLKQRGF